MKFFVKRLVDLILAVSAVIVLVLPIFTIVILVKMTSIGPTLYWSKRMGRNNRIFNMPKFRTMRVDTPSVATHLLGDPGKYTTKIGKTLRKASLDELPQLISIINGDMSFVGPRPALFNQDDLIKQRAERGIHELTPGLTGWAQINGRDSLSISEKVEFDHYYLLHQSFYLDLKIIFRTIKRVFERDGIAH